MKNQLPAKRERRVVNLWFEPDYRPTQEWYHKDEPQWRMEGGLHIPISKLTGLHLFNCWRMCRRSLVASFRELPTNRSHMVIDYVFLRIFALGRWEKILLDELNRRALGGDPAIREVTKLLGGGGGYGSNRLEVNDEGPDDRRDPRCIGRGGAS